VAVDTKIQNTQDKLDEPMKGPKPKKYLQKIDELDSEIMKLLKDIDYLADIGRMAESEKLYDEVERLKSAKRDLKYNNFSG